MSARGSSKKPSRRSRPAPRKGSSIEPAPLTEASPAPRVGLESGGWRKPESRGDDEPAVSHAAADVDERFFADGEKGPVSHRAKNTFNELDEPDPDLRAMLKNAPGAQRRRERYARFVRWVVVAGVAVLTAGLVRVAIAKREYQPVQRPAAVAPAKAEPVVAEPPAVAQQAAQVTGSPAAEAPPATAEQPPAQPEGTKEEAAASAAAAVPTEANPEEAKKAKKESQHALEMGKTKDSIEAGERAVALDPTDAESWLILGAAYQQAGKMADAKRCFKSCLTLGTHGPRGECAAFPH